MNKKLRKKTVLAMDLLIRQVNNEYLLEPWLSLGVPDGEFKEYTVDEVSDYYIEKKEYADLLGLFIKTMAKASKDGGLYSDNVCSRRE